MTEQQATDSLRELLAPYGQRAEADLRQWLIEPGTPGELAEAMRYCVLGGGKRFRPALAYLAAEACGGSGEEEITRRAATAVEIVHTYSLVHDDLPAMDDDDLRRGRPTAHVKFGQAMAILAGDALLTRAFGVLSESGHELSAALCRELARGAGAAGMVAGQVADMGLCRLDNGPDDMRYIPLRKTAALIRAAARMGAISARAAENSLDAVGRYAEALGLAFQVFDDVLDVTGAAEDLGKTPGKDARAGKKTIVAALGLPQARAMGAELTEQAITALGALGPRAGRLKALATLLAERTQ